MHRRKRPKYYNDQMRELIGNVIHSKRDRAMMRMRLCDDVPIEIIAEKFRLSPQRTGEIVREYENILFSEISG